MLTAEEIARYHEQGFLVFERLIHGKMLAHYLGVLREAVERSRTLKPDRHWTFELDADGQVRPEHMLHKIQGVCVAVPEILNLAREAVIVDRVQPLLGPEIDVFGTKFFPMLPGGGTSTKWHQDNFYFDTWAEDIVTCGIYLEDTDRENGCLKVIPGSHREGQHEHVRDVGSYGSWVEVDESRAVHLEIPGGTVILFSANLLHGANPNRSARSRYSTAWHYVPGLMELAQFRRGEYEDRHLVRAAPSVAEA
ncbi:MAG: phytanoyl-CoA dioxygenase family protein [Candidatus Hydrogenedentes bacterium]|nr:phytanoyl-CoA dioxygenase family protein [Candidatus Hydrogenedentota bacterium]